MIENENEIERLIREASETGPGVDVPVSQSAPSQSFRIVGGTDAAQKVIRAASNTAVKKVAVTTVGRGRYLVVPIRDVPMDGYSIAEDGYDANTARTWVEKLLGEGSRLDGSTWAKALNVVDGGGTAVLSLESTSIDVRGKRVFPVRMRSER